MTFKNQSYPFPERKAPADFLAKGQWIMRWPVLPVVFIVRIRPNSLYVVYTIVQKGHTVWYALI